MAGIDKLLVAKKLKTGIRVDAFGSMQDQEHTWVLLSRKLAQQATPKELEELDEALQNDIEAAHAARVITAFWRLSPKTDKLMAEQAYASIAARLSPDNATPNTTT